MARRLPLHAVALMGVMQSAFLLQPASRTSTHEHRYLTEFLTKHLEKIS